MDEEKILIVSDCVFYPQNEGNCRRIYNSIRLMQSLGHTVDFLYYAPEKSTCEKQMKEILGKGQYYFFRITISKSGFFCMHSKGNYFERFAPPDNVDFRYLPELNEKISTLMKKYKYHIIWLEYLYQSKILENIGDSVIKVIDTHDRFAYRNYKMFPFMHKVVNYSTSFSGERKALGRADYVIAIQNEEEKYFKNLLRGKETKVITIGDNHNLVKNAISRNHDICFCGSGNGLNVDALNWFINEVFPIVVSKVKDCRLLVVGRICEKIDIEAKKNICLLGAVDDIDMVYKNCRVVINPVRMGTGLNIKSIEAIAHCKPLVATSAGARGLKGNAPIIAVANDETVFAKKVICFLKDDSLCERYRRNCIKFIEEYNTNNLKAIRKIINPQNRNVKLG